MAEKINAAPWSESEIDTLRRLYSSTAISALVDTLGRSKSAIMSKASKLGIKKNAEGYSNLEFLKSLPIDKVPIELAFKHKEWLSYNYYEKEYSTRDLADMTNCTRKNIEYWMKKYDLPRRDDTTRFTERCLTKISETSKGRVPFSKGLTKHDHPALMKISEKVRGEKSPHWKGGTYITSSGYRWVRDENHPNRDAYNYVPEHRLVMEFVLGRLLTSEEIVHHRDRNRINNVSSNLFVFPDNKSHLRFHNVQNYKDPNITEEEFMDVYYEAYGE